MTSEVLLMNLEAVVLGADSAVTISDATDSFRVSQGGVDKIHILNETGPVAAMVYGGGDFAGLPWKSVLARYRQSHASPGKPIRNQALDLLAFLSSGEGGLEVDDMAERVSFARYLIAFILDYGDSLKIFGWEEGKPVAEAVAAKALARLKASVLNEDTPDANGKPVPRPLLPASLRMADFLKAHLGPHMQAFLGEALDGASFPAAAVQPLIDLAATSVYVEWLPARASPFTTGLVIAGFDGPGLPPTVVTVEFLGSFGGMLQSRAIGSASPRPHSEPVIAATFALDDMTRAFMYGVMPQSGYITHLVTTSLIQRTLSKVLGDANKANPKLVGQITEGLGAMPFEAPAVGLHVARQSRFERATEKLWPILHTANVNILADYAKKFMELPVLEHELMRDESVSRPIRVLAMEHGRYFWKD